MNKSTPHFYRSFSVNRLVFENVEKIDNQPSTSGAEEKSVKPEDAAAQAIQSSEKQLSKLSEEHNFSNLIKKMAAAVAAEMIQKNISGKGVLERLGIEAVKPNEMKLDQIKEQLNDSKFGPMLRKGLGLYAAELIKQNISGKGVLEQMGISSDKPLNDEQIKTWFNSPELSNHLRKFFLIMATEMIQKDLTGKGVLERLEIDTDNPKESE